MEVARSSGTGYGAPLEPGVSPSPVVRSPARDGRRPSATGARSRPSESGVERGATAADGPAGAGGTSEILRDYSPPALAAAIEANLVDNYVYFGKVAQGELVQNEGL